MWTTADGRQIFICGRQHENQKMVILLFWELTTANLIYRHVGPAEEIQYHFRLERLQ